MARTGYRNRKQWHHAVKLSIKRKTLICIVSGVAIFITGGPWLYTKLFREAPLNPFSVKSISNDGVTTATGEVAISGNWKLVAGSQVGYRIKERIALKLLRQLGDLAKSRACLKFLIHN